MGGGARYLAMGEAATAVADDANAMQWNPANMVFAEHPSLSFMYGAFIESSNFQYLSFSSGEKSFGAIGGSFQAYQLKRLPVTE